MSKKIGYWPIAVFLGIIVFFKEYINHGVLAVTVWIIVNFLKNEIPELRKAKLPRGLYEPFFYGAIGIVGLVQIWRGIFSTPWWMPWVFGAECIVLFTIVTLSVVIEFIRRKRLNASTAA